MNTNNEHSTTHFQRYILHISNGKTVDVYEPYNIPFEKGFINAFSLMKDTELIGIKDSVGECHIFPKSSIVAISTEGVVEHIAVGPPTPIFFILPRKNQGGENH